MIQIAILILLLIQAAMLFYCIGLLRDRQRHIAETKFNSPKPLDRTNEFELLKREVWKLKYPPKYKVGETTEEGELVYDVAFNDQKMAGARWGYSVIKDKKKRYFEGTDYYYDWQKEI